MNKGPCSKRSDSAGGAQYLRRAESLARSVPQTHGVKHEVVDGYIVEGRRSGRNMRASVVDVPGRVAVCGPISGYNSVSPNRITRLRRETAPTRALMLEADAQEEPLEFATQFIEYDDRVVPLGGIPAQFPLEQVASGPPTRCSTGVFQVSIEREPYGSAPTAGSTSGASGWLNFTGVAPLWARVYHTPYGGRAATNFLIAESVFGGLFVPRLDLIFDHGLHTFTAVEAYNGDIIVTGTVASTPTGDGFDNLLGNTGYNSVVLRLRRTDEGWQVGRVTLPAANIPPPFNSPRTSVRTRSIAVAGGQIRIVDLLQRFRRATLPTLPPPHNTVAKLVEFTAVRTVVLNEELSGSTQLSRTMVSAAQMVVVGGTAYPAEGAMTLEDGLVVSDLTADTSEWAAPEWTVYAGVCAYGPDFYSLTVTQVGQRGTISGQLGSRNSWTPTSSEPADTPHTTIAPMTKATFTGPHGTSNATSTAFAGSRGLSIGSIIGVFTTGAISESWEPQPLGDGSVILPMYKPGLVELQLVRFYPSGPVVWPVPEAPDAQLPQCTLLRPERVTLSGEVIPERLLYSYAVGTTDNSFLRIVDGGQTIAVASINYDRRFGVWYTGNPLQSSPLEAE